MLGSKIWRELVRVGEWQAVTHKFFLMFQLGTEDREWSTTITLPLKFLSATNKKDPKLPYWLHFPTQSDLWKEKKIKSNNIVSNWRTRKTLVFGGNVKCGFFLEFRSPQGRDPAISVQIPRSHFSRRWLWTKHARALYVRTLPASQFRRYPRDGRWHRHHSEWQTNGSSVQSPLCLLTLHHSVSWLIFIAPRMAPSSYVFLSLNSISQYLSCARY